VSSSRVLITGASGYLGTLFAGAFDDANFEVVAASRNESRGRQESWRKFALGEPVSPELLRGVDVLIHSAWDLSNSNASDAWQRNVVGSRRLLDAAYESGISKVVFVSSMSAFEGTRQSYGLMKLAVERTTLDHHFVVVRPGLVYGEGAGGMAATMEKVAGLPLWPKFSRAGLFMAHGDDVARALVTIVNQFPEFRGKILGLANDKRVDLTQLLTALSRTHQPRPTVPVPAGAVMFALRAAEKLGVKLPFRSDSLLGLVRSSDVLPGKDHLDSAEIHFRALNP
jgi:nucleoside-diphosphate-sugar epimerase